MTEHKPTPFWVNAETIMEMTGLDKAGMLRLRQNNPSWYTVTTKGGYLYNLHQIPEAMIKLKQTA